MNHMYKSIADWSPQFPGFFWSELIDKRIPIPPKEMGLIWCGLTWYDVIVTINMNQYSNTVYVVRTTIFIQLRNCYTTHPTKSGKRLYFQSTIGKQVPFFPSFCIQAYPNIEPRKTPLPTLVARTQSHNLAGYGRNELDHDGSDPKPEIPSNKWTTRVNPLSWNKNAKTMGYYAHLCPAQNITIRLLIRWQEALRRHLFWGLAANNVFKIDISFAASPRDIWRLPQQINSVIPWEVMFSVTAPHLVSPCLPLWPHGWSQGIVPDFSFGIFAKAKRQDVRKKWMFSVYSSIYPLASIMYPTVLGNL